MSVIEAPRLNVTKGTPVGTIYSNFDHSFDQHVIDRMTEPNAFAQHAAWDFCGYVTRMEGGWHEQVWQYGEPIADYAADDLAELILYVVDEWGTA